MLFVEEGDHMIAMYPNYQSSYEIANSIPNCEFSKWNINDNGEWEMDF